MCASVQTPNETPCSVIVRKLPSTPDLVPSLFCVIRYFSKTSRKGDLWSLTHTLPHYLEAPFVPQFDLGDLESPGNPDHEARGLCSSRVQQLLYVSDKE